MVASDKPILAVGVVNDGGRYVVDMTDVLLTYGKTGLETDHIVQAEMEGQVYKVVVQPPAVHHLFLPLISEQSPQGSAPWFR